MTNEATVNTAVASKAKKRKVVSLDKKKLAPVGSSFFLS